MAVHFASDKNAELRHINELVSVVRYMPESAPLELRCRRPKQITRFRFSRRLHRRRLVESGVIRVGVAEVVVTSGDFRSGSSRFRRG